MPAKGLVGVQLAGERPCRSPACRRKGPEGAIAGKPDSYKVWLAYQVTPKPAV